MIPQNTMVLRDGRLQVHQASELVPGDLVLVRSGDKVPADMRLVHCDELKVKILLQSRPDLLFPLFGFTISTIRIYYFHCSDFLPFLS